MTAALLPASCTGALLWLYFQCRGPLQRADGANMNRNFSFAEFGEPEPAAVAAGAKA